MALDSQPLPDSRRIRARLNEIERAMGAASNSQVWDQLSRAYERMFRVYCYILNVPAPGSRRPAPEPRKKTVQEDVSPSVPAALDLLRETE